MATILCIDDEVSAGLILEDTLERAGHRPLQARNVVEALQVLSREHVDLIISDFRMPGVSGLDFLPLLRGEGYETPLIMLTGHGSIENAVEAIKAGAIDYITKPVRADQIELAVEQALEVIRLRRENESLRSEVIGFRSERQIIGDNPAMRRLLQTVAMAAPTRATVLLQGESGTGKELFARAIHDRSDRRDGPFIQINCAALPDGLVESALFGHERGAFTGAVKRVEGAFERANGGTLLLDEISEMRLDLQAKLLRVLQEQEFERVGGTQMIRVDVRIIATTNRDLDAEVKAGRFREDLFYRLSVLPIVIPPLRERMDDVSLLAQRFAMRTAQEIGKEFTGIAPEAVSLLQRYDWPGNVRELQHAIERAVILSSSPVLLPHVFDQLRGGTSASRAAPIRSGGAPLAGPVNPGVRFDPSARGEPTPGGVAPAERRVVLTSLNVDEAEQVLIREALERTGNNRTHAAKLLGMSVRTLRSKLNGPGGVGGGVESAAD